MKPKTVGRVEGGNASPQRAEIIHTGVVAGTLIRTADGELPAEYLTAGDRIVTRNAGMVPLEDVKIIRTKIPAIALKAGAMGEGQPAHTIMLPAAHQILIRDWRAMALGGAAQAVLPAGCLVDGEFITDLGLRAVMLVQFGFATPYVIYADGMELSVPAIAQTSVRAA